MTSHSGFMSDPRGWETPLIRVTPGPRLLKLCPADGGQLWAEGEGNCNPVLEAASRRWCPHFCSCFIDQSQSPATLTSKQGGRPCHLAWCWE